MRQKMFPGGTLVTVARRCNNLLFNILKQRKTLHSCYFKKKPFLFFVPTNTLQYSSDSPLKCWNCNFIYESKLFCPKCKTLQEPPKNLTYFDLMDIPESYDVTLTQIQRKYKELQKLFHPDKFGTKTEKEKQLSENLSSLINNAYTILSSPLQRGLYMLKLNKIIISEGTDNMDPEFLMEIMERNEKIENALNNHTKIKELTKENEIILNNLSMDIAKAFQEKDMEKAKAHLIRMKYYDSINKRLKKLKHDLGIVE
ncbi:iron-sulfur cluster co-chaperone protein HscB-like protein, mitochondrial [Augochlora pura]